MKLRIFILFFSLFTLAGSLVMLGIWAQQNDAKRDDAERKNRRRPPYRRHRKPKPGVEG